MDDVEVKPFNAFKNIDGKWIEMYDIYINKKWYGSRCTKENAEDFIKWILSLSLPTLKS